MNFNAKEVKNQCIKWIRQWFENNGKGCNAIIGISGGKDSSVVAALCVEALGADRVIGILMPNGEQKDISEVVATSIHNYIDTKNMILRKGAISANKGERVAIPMNMRDGILVGYGKGNENWNFSAPHGAGRLYSRSRAKEIFTVDEYEKSMKGIYTTCVSHSTLDEAPFVYKDYREIRDAIEPTVDVMYRLKPIYNFKAYLLC